MKFVAKVLLVGSAILGAANAHAASVSPQGSYRFYLYFGDTKPFTDDVTITIDSSRGVQGTMHVPNDFDAPLERVVLNNGKLTFHVTLPHKYDQAFPGGLNYTFLFESPVNSATTVNYDHFVGFVGLPSKTYVGSVVGFKQGN